MDRSFNPPANEDGLIVLIRHAVLTVRPAGFKNWKPNSKKKRPMFESSKA
jgi:hypothetical protein